MGKKTNEKGTNKEIEENCRTTLKTLNLGLFDNIKNLF